MKIDKKQSIKNKVGVAAEVAFTMFITSKNALREFGYNIRRGFQKYKTRRQIIKWLNDK